MEESSAEKTREESGNQVTSQAKPVQPSKSGPFMSLILHRLDPNNLPRVTTVPTNDQDESDDDIQMMSDGDDSGDDADEKGWEQHKQSTGDTHPRKAKQRRLEKYDSGVSDNADCVRKSSRNSGKQKVRYSFTKSHSEESNSSASANENSSNSLSDSDSESASSVYRSSSGRYCKTPLKKPLKKATKYSHQDYCYVCKDGGDLLCCDSCIHVFHLSCLDPPLTSMPKFSWNCSACSTDTDTIDKVDQIFTWRKKGHGRELFVHFSGKSYWQCRWVQETQLRLSQPQKVVNFYLKYGRKEPPNLDEGDARRKRKNNQDPLEIRFYQNGVRPEWLRINRVIDHRSDSGGYLNYLVKWQQLGYDCATWEDESSCEEIAGEFSVAIRVYHELLHFFWGDTGLPATKNPFVYEHVVVPPKMPISDLKRKLEKQPNYIPRGLTLHDYQLDGLNWLRYSWAKGINTILGDEMGLGKTIQTIVFLNSLYREGHCRGPFLISAPLSTLLNWEREFEAWAPELYVVTYTGDQDTRLLIRRTEFVQDSSYMTASTRKLRSPVKFHVLLTSYQFPSIDATCLGSIPWEMIIIDEGHRLKDDGTLLFKDLMKYTTSYKLLLTGTPLQNNLEELFNLLNFLCPKKFSNASAFLTKFEDIAKEDQIKRLHSLLGPHLLRRMKVDVLKDMPSKSELIVRVELSPMQKQFSKHILMKNFKALNAKGGRHTSMLNVFMDLRKVCNHPYLFSTASADAPEDPVTGLYELEAMMNASGKLVMLRKMLELLKKQGHRVLIFSQMTTMLDILEEFIQSLGYVYERIDGRIRGSIRQDAIDRFNAEGAEQFVFLLSTKAGGLGINLATADTVIIYDSDWNPHNDIQAFSRAHRIGQKNKVMIYRFITRRSVEEKMVHVCKRKMMLTHLIVRPEVGKSVFTKNDIQDIVRFGTEELFKDKEATAPIYYTDAMIEDILDRTQGEEKESNDWMNDYFQGFKVASCEVQEEAESVASQEEANDPDQWKYLLREEFKKKDVDGNDLSNYGKGKRKKPYVKYAETTAETNKFVSTRQNIQFHPKLRLVNSGMRLPSHLDYVQQLMQNHRMRMVNPMEIRQAVNYRNQIMQTGQPINYGDRLKQLEERVNCANRLQQIGQPMHNGNPPTSMGQPINNGNRPVQTQQTMLNINSSVQIQPNMPFGNGTVGFQPRMFFACLQNQASSAVMPVMRPNKQADAVVQQSIEGTPRPGPQIRFRNPSITLEPVTENVRESRERNSGEEEKTCISIVKEIICIDID
ncbi:unnamed protein product [Allacma fusca]|uniref:Chromodomain-helicase-DNA-binding protein 3 n=1 Tax=Allacma fusca TaxID=39272 RepID=A0A8J2PF34_9HEXA|nr:unnamed protein product [Allacma fusca]